MEFTFHSIIQTHDHKAEPREAARNALKTAIEKLQGLAKSMPDDREDLQEEKDMWVESWGKELVSPTSIAIES